jgi:glycosyltransferase involved in cell wall biosynthesis
MGKKVLYIWDADYPWDVRVEKICKTLARHGYEVHIVARNLKRLPEYERQGDLRIHRLKPIGHDKVNYGTSFPLFFSPFWKRFLDRIIREQRIDLIIVRDLPMAIAGIWAGKRHGIPVIFDMAEDYVAMLWDIWRAKKFKGFNLILRNPYLARHVERYVFQKADHILVVVEEARDVVLSRGGAPSKISIVGNTSPLELFSNHEITMNEELQEIRNHFSAIYTGGVQMGRGIQVVLEAMPEIIKVIPGFLFVIVGDGYATAQLKGEVIRRELGEYVLWVGWVDHARIFDYIKLSKIGLIPHFASDHTNTTIPNKIFDYMGLGIPVISSDAVPMKRILEEKKCGLVFKSGDAKSLSSAILEMYKSHNDYGNNCVEAVRNEYNWENDGKRLIQIIQHFDN